MDSGGCAIPSERAARPKCACSARASAYRRCRASIPPVPFAVHTRKVSPPSLHTAAPHHRDPARWLLSTAALALALWLGERGYCAWGRCAAPGCDRCFIGTGRRAPQRYCSTRCGTRVGVAAHRDRGR
ncbi:CGNR zinc finger domain-containing protein [Streptomyces griseofuscus]|uniref:CGNR zinc finger domain-containing protein n=1 Tax=Streptomyces TaxID=1883 RepID=UPI001AEC30A2|nr:MULTISPECIES: CGNR zinc finger domain-containing protein [unclassified Streptomyces]